MLIFILNFLSLRYDLNQAITFFEKPRYMTCYNDFSLIAFFINHGHENSTGTLTAKKYFIIKVLDFH